ncbi:hypothetical protein [Pseudorhodoferax sp. Leaf265]|uniref:hypothetical protein n=1 Tax=Pseudorhodoferax sp. Leaf265 TaxID=1736315 RepID=UPI0012E82922|nr:hypothetical protein [Pseudorhodoferax sp. Leaf265]
MLDYVEYELVNVDNLVTDPEDLDYFPLSGAGDYRLALAHRVANLLLKHRFTSDFYQPYHDRSGNTIILPQSVAGESTAKLMLDKPNPIAMAKISEIAAVMNCKFVPLDGGPEVSAEGDALAFDVLARSLRRLRPGGQSIFQQLGGAERASRLISPHDKWE